MTLRESEHSLGDTHEEDTERETEKIVSAALRYKGEMFLGAMHAIAYIDLEEKYPEYGDGVEEGFLTSTGRFVGRKEAHDIAVRNQGMEANADGMLLSQNLKFDKLH